jgi:hypothetical protein
VKYHLIVRPELKKHMDGLYAAAKQDPGSDAAKEFNAAMKALSALRDGRENEYQAKQLGYGPGSHDLRDAAELKVPVFEEVNDRGRPMGPSHRLVYREFEPLPTVEDGRVVQDPNATPYREAVAFAHRSQDPAAIAGAALGRTRGLPERDLHGVTGGGRPSVGPQQQGVQTTPHRVPVPRDLIRQAAILRDSPPAGSRATPGTGASEAAAKRPDGPGKSHPQER